MSYYNNKQTNLNETILTNNRYNNSNNTKEQKKSNHDNNQPKIYFPNEIDFDNFTILDKIVREQQIGSWSARILYNKQILKIQTPILLTAFDLTPHIYKNAKRAKYSLCLSLDKTIDGVLDLIGLVNEIDATALRTFIDNKDTPEIKEARFVKVIKYSDTNKDTNSTFPPTIRCNLVNNVTHFKCAITKNGVNVKDTTINHITNLLKKGTKVRAIIELNPVWFNGLEYLDKTTNKKLKSWGISWRIVALDIVKPNIQFRTTNV